MGSILHVLVYQWVHKFLCMFTLKHLGLTVSSDPPKLIPVVVVVIDKQGDRWVLGYVPKALEVGRGLRLVVYGNHDSVASEGVGSRHQVRLPAGIDGTQPEHPASRKGFSALPLRHLHGAQVTPTSRQSHYLHTQGEQASVPLSPLAYPSWRNR